MATTKEIKDFPLKTGVEGQEDLLIQDNGITKRIKANEFLNQANLNDYVTSDDLNQALTNKADLTDIPSLDGYATKEELNNKVNVSDLSDVATTGSYEDLLNKPIIPTQPTKLSQLTNDKGYITSIPDEYITDTELISKNYATETFVTTKIAEASLSAGEPESNIIYKPDITSFNLRVTNQTTFIIAQPLPITGVISSVKFDAITDVYLTLFTKTNDDYFTPYARHLIEMDESGNVSLNKPITVSKENTYIGISGRIAYQNGINSTSEINRMYDFRDTPVIGNPVQAEKSLMVLWFAMELSMVTSANPVEILETRLNAKIKELNKEIDYLKYMIGNSGGSNLSDDSVKNLRNVWDLNLDKKIDGWVYSNATLNESGTLCLGKAKAYYNQYLTFDTYQQKSTVVVNDVNSQFGLICHNGVKGALYLVDGVNKRISLHNNYTGGDIPNVKVSTPLPFDLQENGNYLLHVVKTGWKHTFTITDLTTMISCSVEFDNATQPSSGSYCGKGWGGPGVATFAGSVLFKNHRYHVALYPKARALFIGDSITEGTNMGAGVDIKYRWCSLLRDQYFNYDAIICGRGGATSDDILSRMNSLEVLGVKADIVIVLDGTNERNQSATDNWKVKMPQIRDKIISWGSKPIICVPPVSSSGFEYISQMRDFILEQGWDTIRMDIATSLNGDGVTYDGSLYTDGVHPNRKGGEQMFARAVKDLDVIL